jgi:ATP-dependent exoDNAse (exonuclease V) beta subunit
VTLLEGFREQILREQDRDARRAAQTRFDRPLVLQAGAGTGKTTTLIGRLLSWTLGTGWERTERRLAERAASRPFGRPEEVTPDRIAAEVLGRVVAITFTEAAAAEMAGRAARELACLSSGGEVPDWLDASLLPPAPERTARARSLLGTLDHLAVRTIHAFCRGLLADHPLEAGVHPDLVIDADGRRVEEIVQETVEDVLREGYGPAGLRPPRGRAGAGSLREGGRGRVSRSPGGGLPGGPWARRPPAAADAGEERPEDRGGARGPDRAARRG